MFVRSLLLGGDGRLAGLPSWNPSFLTPLLWLRPDMGVTLNAGNVLSWANQGSAGGSFGQAVAADQPPYSGGGGVNDRPYVEVGPDKWLQSSSAALLAALHKADSSFWCVAQAVDPDPSVVNAISITALLATATSTGTGPGIGYFSEDRNAVIPGGAGVRLVSYTSAVTQYDSRSSSGAFPGATWRYVEFFYAPATAVVIQSNGAAVAITPGPYTPQATDPPGLATIGRLLAAPSAGTRHRICEMGATVGVPNADNLAALRRYIRTRYGVNA